MKDRHQTVEQTQGWEKWERAAYAFEPYSRWPFRILFLCAFTLAMYARYREIVGLHYDLTLNLSWAAFLVCSCTLVPGAACTAIAQLLKARGKQEEEP